MPVEKKSPPTPDSPVYDRIPVFAFHNLYVPKSYNPIEAQLVQESDEASLFNIGPFDKGVMYIIKPKDPDKKTVHFEHRLDRKHKIVIPKDTDYLGLINEISKRDQKEVLYFEGDDFRHWETQNVIRDYWDFFSTTLESEEPQLIKPQSFLEVFVENDIENSGGWPIDLIAITRTGEIFIVEIASRSNEDYRRHKYRYVEKREKAFKEQFGKGLPTIPVCLFYEVCDANNIYLSLRYAGNHLGSI